MRILVVDDDLIQQQTLACFLKGHGFDVETALTGLEAIRKTRTDKFHVVLMDHAMPEIDGASAGNVIRRHRGVGGFPWLIALTANVNEVVRQEAGSSTVFDMLQQKPWHPVHLLELLKTCERPVPGEAERAMARDEGVNASDAVTDATIAWRYNGFFHRGASALRDGKTKVLLVDDDPALLAEFTVSLKGMGYEVDTAPNRAAALERMAVQPYDVVMADYLKLNRFCGSQAAFAQTSPEAPAHNQPQAKRASATPIGNLVTPQQSEPVSATLRVLVAEDSGLNRDVLASILRAAGHEVICVESGADAAATALHTELDVVLMGLRMPLLSGLEACQRIREDTSLQGCVPIIALTAQVSDDQIEQWRKAGMDGYLAKPFEQGAVLAVVARAAAVKQRATAGRDTSMRALAQSLLCVTGSEFATLDQEIFDRTKQYLGAAKAASYVEMLAVNTRSLLDKLTDGAGATPAELVDETHALGGSAGMFGFIRLLEVSRLFERAVKDEATDVAQYMRGLQAALEVTRDELGRQAGRYSGSAAA